MESSRALGTVGRAGLLAFLLLVPAVCPAQPKSELAPPAPIPPAEGAREARALLSNLLAQKPQENATNTGLLTIHAPDRPERTAALLFEIIVLPDHWVNSYESAPTENQPGERLAIQHWGETNTYWWSEIDTNGQPRSAPRQLTGNQLMRPFAGSDFWLADLGLEFLQWPGQRILKKEMRKSLFCDVLQSTNPHPAPGAYQRVVTWVAANRPEEIVIVHADAYDYQNKLLKEFDPKKVEKINGVWQLEEIEIRNRQTDSRTKMEFHLQE